MKKSCLLGAVCACAFSIMFSPSVAATTATINVDQDVELREQSPNYSDNGATLSVGNQHADWPLSPGLYESMLGFDVSSITNLLGPHDQLVINSMTLKVWAQGTAGSGLKHVALGNTDSWTDTTATWNTSAGNHGAIMDSTTGTWDTYQLWDVTAVAVEELTVNDYVTFYLFIDPPNEVNFRNYISKEGAPVLEKPAPILEIDYSINFAAPTLSIVIPEGTPQECNAASSRAIPMHAQYTIDDADALDTISWTLDGSPAASGEYVNILVPLSVHTVGATVTTILGKSATDSKTITVEDTTAPVVSTAFIDAKTGAEVTTINSSDKADVSYSVSDACDPEPTVISATIGMPAENGDTVTAKISKKNESVSVSIQGNVDNTELVVTAEDASGNMSSSKAVLTIIQ